MPKRNDELDRQNAIGLLEEAFFLVRSAPLSVLALYYIGSVPFVIAFVFFCSEMATSPSAADVAFSWSFGLAAAYLWMKVFQAHFAAELNGLLMPPDAGGEGRTGVGFTLRRAAALAFLHGFSIPAHLVAGVLTLPIGWTIAFFQNASVLVFSRDFGRGTLRRLIWSSAALSHHRALENHAVLFIWFLFGFFVWLNIFSLFLVVPLLFKMLTGIGSVFTTNSLAAMGNTTTIAVTVSLTFLVTGPVFKALYVLRCFYGLAESTGDDLLARLRAHRRRVPRGQGDGRGPSGRGTHSAAALAWISAVGVATLGFTVGGLQAAGQGQEAGRGQAGEQAVVVEQAPDPAGSPPPDALGTAIAKELKHKRYQWRLPRDGSLADGAADERDPKRFGARLVQWVNDTIADIENAIRKKLRELFGVGDAEEGFPSGFGGAFAGIGVLQAVVYIAVLAIVVAAVWFGLRTYRRRRARLLAEGAGLAVPAEVDLESDDVLADALEEDQWLALARSKSDAGEFRLAVRAVFLACLAHLAERRVVSLQKFKSNHDYLDEVSRKAHGHDVLKRSFDATTGVFERVWYGEHTAGPEMCDELRSQFNRIKDDV